MELRRNRRFSLSLPLSIVPVGTGDPTPWLGLTRNISATGVLFFAEHCADPGGAIEYTITLKPDPGDRVNIRCLGTVVRCDVAHGSQFRYEVAATLERYEFLREN